MDLFNLVLEKYGLKVAIVVFLIKTFWELIIGSTKKYIKAIDTNTEAINVLNVKMDKVSKDLSVAFFNIKSVKGGKLELPNKIDQ